MDAKTSAALEASIEKWRKIVEGTGADRGVENCALCAVFDQYPAGCFFCPVYERVQHHYCTGTPYTEWAKLFPEDRDAIDRKADTPERVAAAKAELAFLESLREGPPPPTGRW